MKSTMKSIPILSNFTWWIVICLVAGCLSSTYVAAQEGSSAIYKKHFKKVTNKVIGATKIIQAHQTEQDKRINNLFGLFDVLKGDLTKLNTPQVGPTGPKGPKGEPGLPANMPGEDRLEFEVYNPDNVSYSCVEVDVQKWCGDSDGCTMRVLLQSESNSSDQVKNAHAKIFIENSETSNNNAIGLFGHSMGHNAEYDWVLGNGNRYNIWAPWSWIYVSNFRRGACPEQNGLDGLPFEGDKIYVLSFMTPPSVRARVIVKDDAM